MSIVSPPWVARDTSPAASQAVLQQEAGVQSQARTWTQIVRQLNLSVKHPSELVQLLKRMSQRFMLDLAQWHKRCFYITCQVGSNHLVKVVCDTLFRYKSLVSLLQLINILREDTLRLYKYSALLHPFTMDGCGMKTARQRLLSLSCLPMLLRRNLL